MKVIAYSCVSSTQRFKMGVFVGRMPHKHPHIIFFDEICRQKLPYANALSQQSLASIVEINDGRIPI
jgi:hypothetical protein